MRRICLHSSSPCTWELYRNHGAQIQPVEKSRMFESALVLGNGEVNHII
jgi:hypothetical protein